MLKWHKLGIKNKVFIIFIIIQLAIIALSFYYFSENHRHFYLEQEEISLKNYSNLILNDLEKFDLKNQINLDDKVTDWAADTESRITIINAAGIVLADSSHQASEMDNHRNRPEVAAVLGDSASKMAIRHSNTIGEKMLYLARPILRNGQIVGVVRIARSLSFIQSVLIKDIKNYLFFFVILGAITIFLSWQLTNSIIKPLETMTNTAEKISQGHLSQRIPARKYNSDIAKLSKMFNYMAAELEDKINEISQEKNRIETILESMVDGVIAVDKERRVSLINPAAQKIFNISEKKVKGRELISSLFSHRIDMYLQRALDEKNSISREINYQNPDNKIIQATFIPLLSKKKKINGGVIVLTDITELRKLETVRNDFVANVSHELRTPLTSIIGYLDTLLESEIKDSQTRNKFLKIIKEEADRLSILISDLLNLSKIESESIDLKAENFSDVILKVINLLEKNAEQKEINLEVKMPDQLPFVYMVKEQIEQVLVNLIDNAIKYTPARGKVEIVVKKTGDKVYFAITDTGIGIPAADQDRIFERFYRVDKARSRSLGGTGIGLSIVRNIIKQHGSEVKVKSNEGQGSTFSFYLKVARS